MRVERDSDAGHDGRGVGMEEEAPEGLESPVRPIRNPTPTLLKHPPEDRLQDGEQADNRLHKDTEGMGEGEEGSGADPLVGRTLLSSYLIVQVLGRGHFSTTYLANELPSDPDPEPPDTSNHAHHLSNPTPHLVAIKRVSASWLNPMGQVEFETLHMLHNHISPRNIIKPLSAFLDEENIFHLVLEPLDSARPVALPEGCMCKPSSSPQSHPALACPERHYVFQKLMVQFFSGLHEVHRHGMMHADLTPANVLYLPESNRIKIIDFGNVIRVEECAGGCGEEDYQVQSAHYRAPEILLGAGPVERKIDVWGAGMVGLEWLLGKQGRRELERELQPVVCAEGRVELNSDVGRQPVMAVSTPSRKALVMRMMGLFGCVECYRHGLFWTDEYDCSRGKSEPGDEHECSIQKILHGFLLSKTQSIGLAELLGKMLHTNVSHRKASAEILRDPWLVQGLLGEWASVLLGGMVDGHNETLNEERVREPGQERISRGGEDMGVETVDDSGFAESADGNLPEEDVLSPQKQPAVTEKDDEFYLPSTNQPPSPTPLIHPTPQTPISQRPKTIRRLECILAEDTEEIPFVSPTSFPFPYTRFCPFPPLPNLFSSPSPEPLPPPSPTPGSNTFGMDGSEDEELVASDEVVNEALRLRETSQSIPSVTERIVHHSREDKVKGPHLSPFRSDGDRHETSPANTNDHGYPPPKPQIQSKQETTPHELPTIKPPADIMHGIVVQEERNYNVWHMDLNIGLQVCKSFFFFFF